MLAQPEGEITAEQRKYSKKLTQQKQRNDHDEKKMKMSRRWMNAAHSMLTKTFSKPKEL